MTPHRDRAALVVAALATVAWAGWRLPDAPRVVPTALVVAVVVLAVLSVPVALLVAVGGRRIPTRLRHKERAITVVHGLVLVGWLVAGRVAPASAGVASVFGSLAAVVSLLVVLPLAVGAIAADRRGVGFRTVVLAWPPSLVAGVLVFLAPAPGGVDLTRYNATFLEGPALVATMAAAVGVAVLGPAAAAAVGGRGPRR